MRRMSVLDTSKAAFNFLPQPNTPKGLDRFGKNQDNQVRCHFGTTNINVFRILAWFYTQMEIALRRIWHVTFIEHMKVLAKMLCSLWANYMYLDLN